MCSKNILIGPKALYPTPKTSLGAHLYETLVRHGDRIAQIDAITGETRTFHDILLNSLSIAEYLVNQGLRSGDAVGICSENDLDFILPVIATYFIGATCAPLNPNYTLRELHHALNISKPSVIFCSERSVESIDRISHKVEFIKIIIVFKFPLSQKHISFRSLLNNKSKSFKLPEVDYRNLTAVILCSSGTTGFPKGVMLTHENILHAVAYMRDYRYGDIKASDTLLALLPMFHAFMFLSQLMATMIGAKIVVMNRFDQNLFLKSIQKYKITLLYLVPPIIVFLAKSDIISKYDLSSIRDIISGAAPLKQEVETLAAERLGLQQIRQGYGLTEATLALIITPTHKKKRGSSGIIIPETECKVVDLETGQTVGPLKEGELCFRGPGIMKGYCGDLQSTSSTIDSDGFLHTGDVGYYDEDGFFFIVDRVKELIKYKGFQVPPAELEAVLLTHPAIKDAAVTGVPDEKAGELPCAFVVREPGRNITKEDVMEFVAGQVSPQKRLHGGVYFIDSIPKTPSGKILRRELKKLLKSKL